MGQLISSEINGINGLILIVILSKFNHELWNIIVRYYRIIVFHGTIAQYYYAALLLHGFLRPKHQLRRNLKNNWKY